MFHSISYLQTLVFFSTYRRLEQLVFLLITSAIKGPPDRCPPGGGVFHRGRTEEKLFEPLTSPAHRPTYVDGTSTTIRLFFLPFTSGRRILARRKDSRSMEAQIAQAEERVAEANAEVTAATEAMGRAVAAAEEVCRDLVISSRILRFCQSFCAAFVVTAEGRDFLDVFFFSAAATAAAVMNVFVLVHLSGDVAGVPRSTFTICRHDSTHRPFCARLTPTVPTEPSNARRPGDHHPEKQKVA